MPGAGRRGDKAQVPSDSHGCTGCPHPALGPAVCGSSNVNINGIPALRVGDQGIHGACCGGNTWEAVRGAKGVFINGRPAYRIGDASQHCGGVGRLIEGSQNVLIGDLAGGTIRPPVTDDAPVREVVSRIRVLSEVGKPLRGVLCEVLVPEKGIQRLQTDGTGWIAVRHPEAILQVELMVLGVGENTSRTVWLKQDGALPREKRLHNMGFFGQDEAQNGQSFQRAHHIFDGTELQDQGLSAIEGDYLTLPEPHELDVEILAKPTPNQGPTGERT